MAIKEIKGNIIHLGETGQLDGWVHGCNCYHAMGSGIAGQVARRYPAVPEADRVGSAYGDPYKIGTYTKAHCTSIVDPAITFTVFNAYTQIAPSYNGEDVFQYNGLHTVLTDFVGRLDLNRTEPTPYRLGIPKIGAGLAGGDWERIQHIIHNTLGRSNIDVYIIEWDGTTLE